VLALPVAVQMTNENIANCHNNSANIIGQSNKGLRTANTSSINI